MVQLFDLAESAPSQNESVKSRFHSFRLLFNSAFLAEDFVSAEETCLKALELNSLSEAESEELISYLRMLGKGELALDTLDKLLSETPRTERIHKLKLDLLLQLGWHDRFEQTIIKAMEIFPESESLYRTYYEFLQTNRRAEEAENLALQASGRGITLLRVTNPAISSEDEEHDITVSDPTLRSFMLLFSGRENAYARQWLSDQGQSGYTLVNEPLCPQVARNHILGNYTLGIYQLDTRSFVGWIVFDLDLNKDQHNDLNNPEFMSWANAILLEKVQEMVQLLAFYHVPCSVEDSGFKGYHVWVFLEERISASLAKAFAERIAAQVSLDELPMHWELFPKQSRVKQGYGNLVKLPYGIHRRSGKFCTMLDAEYRPLPLADFMASVKRVDSLTFVAALSSLGYIHSEIAIGAENHSTDDSPPIAVQADPEDDLEWLCLKQNCCVLNQIDSLIKTRKAISGLQKNALRYTVGYLKNGPAIVNKLLSMCQNVCVDDYMKSGFKGNASGCAKLRATLSSELDLSQCNCAFECTSAGYLNPLLHLVKLEDSGSKSSDLNELKLKELVDSYLRLLKNHKELTRRLETTEAGILKLFEHIGIDHISTDYGSLCFGRTKNELVLNLKVSPISEA